MQNIFGRYDVAMDAKGRFPLPAGFRKQLGEGGVNQFVINCGFEHSLNLYTMDVWQVIAKNISKLSDFNENQRRLKRLFLDGVSIVETDSAGRLLLQKHLISHAKITKDIVFNAQGNKVELWDSTTYESFINHTAPDYSAIAARVDAEMGGSFNPFAID